MHVTTKPHEKVTTNQPDPFLGLSYLDPLVFQKAKQQMDQRVFSRKQLAAILKEYNKKIGNDALSLENCKKLEEASSYCIVAGQQLGMMGGPIYTILKGISCLLAAKEAGAVPIFWLATEDHDIAEIDHAYLLDAPGNLKKFQLSLTRNGSSIESLKLTSKNVTEVQAFWNFLEMGSMPLPEEGSPYSEFMAHILVRLFSGTGMVFLEPKLLRTLSIPFFAREVKECGAIQEVLKKTTTRLEETGAQAIIKVGEQTNLFMEDQQHKRLKLRFDGDAFTAGKEKFSLNEILKKIEREPELFSCNVAARPVLQNLLLPVLAYIAGPSEIDYHRQLGNYHQYYGITIPCLIPRISATLITPYAASLLKEYDLKPWSNIPQQWRDVMQLGSGSGLHFLRNLIHPHEKPQERVLNWWGFQALSRENLVEACLGQLSWKTESHYYLYI